MPVDYSNQDITSTDLSGVDLSGGKVLIAFDKDQIIDFEDIKKKILSNGQNATDLQIIKI